MDNINHYTKKDTRKKRIILLDEIRGFCVLCMVIYHALYTLTFVVPVPFANVFFKFFTPAEPFFAATFILISGIASRLTRSNLKRGVILLAISLALTLVTFIVIPNELIVFGILHFLSICMILYGLLGKYIDKIPTLITLPLFIFGAICFWGFLQPSSNIFIGIDGLFIWSVPQWLKDINFLWILGIRNSSFYSADYFPLLPWIFFFFIGGVIGKYAKNNHFPKFSYASHIKPLAFLGKHSLIIYIIHQPIIYGISLIALQFLK